MHAALLIVLLSTPTRNDTPCVDVGSPFGEEKASALEARVFSRFGEPRVSYIRGHKHAGVDMKGVYRAAIYPVCAGQVTALQLSFPHLTIVVRHTRPDGTSFHSSYKHVTDLRVKEGDLVTRSTVMSRIFDEDEHRRAKFGRAPVHLHFEVLVRTDDEGEASWSSMSMEALRRYRSDPMALFRTRG